MVGGIAQRHHTGFTRRKVLNDAFDGAIFAAGIAPFKKHLDTVSVSNDVFLKFDRFNLQVA
jgi:hypothetical protein